MKAIKDTHNDLVAVLDKNDSIEIIDSYFSRCSYSCTKWVERHVILDRTDWGSEQIASVEPIGQIKLIKELKIALDSITKRKVFDSEY